MHIPFVWDNAAHTLTVGVPVGNTPVTTVTYTGEPVTVTL